MKAEIIAIGSELVSGQSLDTNSQWLSRALGDLGISVHFHTSLGDDLAENVHVFRSAIGRADLVLTSGGLGPTQDDLTREALAHVAGVGLVEDLASLEAIRGMFARRNRVMSERNRVQALFPLGAEPLPNAIGTAPGIALKVDRAWVACLPGVPHEMKRMFDEQVVPLLRREGFAEGRVVHRKINLFGKGESEVEAEALDLTARGRVPEVGITASESTIAFRIAARAPTEDEANALIAPTAALIYERFGDLIVGEGSEDVVDALARELARTGRTLASAESGSGGLLARTIASVPGFGRHYLGGLVLDTDLGKSRILGVPEAMIEEHSAVSAEVAAEMASQVRERFGVDLGLAIAGVAGPGDATPEVPNGVVFLSLSTADETRTRKLELGPEQPIEVIRKRATKQAINWARLVLKHLDSR